MYFTPMKKSSLSETYMHQALSLAEEVLGSTAPNPAVGAIIVKDGVVIGKGATAPVGGPHAEVFALKQAGEDARGADLYVTLEPCNHHGKTPPCSIAIIDAGIRRVFVAVKDPNPLVAGSGILAMQKAGIEVTVGLLKKEALRLNEHFFHFIQTKEPWVSIKLAMTLDGRIADSTGTSKWITGPVARKEVHRLRAQHSAIGVGSRTLKADNPELTVRGVSGDDPIRIVFSSDVTVGAESYFRNHAAEKRSIIAVLNVGESCIEKDTDGVELWYLGTNNSLDGMAQFLKMAGEQGIDSLFIEGGSTLISTFLELHKVHRLYLFYAPKILGGGTDGLQLEKSYPMNAALTLKEVETSHFDEDFMITGLAHWQKEDA